MTAVQSPTPQLSMDPICKSIIAKENENRLSLGTSASRWPASRWEATWKSQAVVMTVEIWNPERGRACTSVGVLLLAHSPLAGSTRDDVMASAEEETTSLPYWSSPSTASVSFSPVHQMIVHS